MASRSQIVFWSLITLILILVAVIVLIIGFGVSGKNSISVATLTSAGNIGEDGILGCTFEPDITLSNIEIRWAKDGVLGMVHEFKGGKDQLRDQDEMFKGRTAVFAEQVIGGNASLMLRDVQLSDAGAYRCSVTTSKGSGEAGLEYKTGAFSSPEVHVDYNSSMDSLRCEAPRWFPQPMVIWTSHYSSRDNVSEISNTSFKLNSGNMTMKVVSVLHNITANTTYTCVIKNDIAEATGDIKVTELIGSIDPCYFEGRRFWVYLAYFSSCWGSQNCHNGIFTVACLWSGSKIILYQWPLKKGNESNIKKTVHLQLLDTNMASASLSPLALYGTLLPLMYLMAL